MNIIKKYLEDRNPEVTLFFGYVSYIIIGVIFLSISFFRLAHIPFLDNLFITVSAISTTGLATINIAENYSILGQIVILILIQFGGIGYMTFGSFIILSTKHSLSQDREVVHKTAFSLPKEFKISKFIKSIVVYTLSIEVIGTILLYFAFRGDPRVNPVWSAFFHSVSSFCTAGFSLYSNSFESYANNTFLNLIVFALSFLGAIGYIVMVDVWLVLKGKKDNITFTSKVIITTTITLLILGTLFLFTEAFFKNDTSLIRANVLLQSFFQTMTALTTVGFNTVPIGALKSSSLFILTLLMIIGASPSGTGGGIKSTTLSALFGILGSIFSYKKEFVNYKIKQDKKVITRSTKHNKLLGVFSIKKPEVTTEEIIENADDLDSIFGEIFKIKLMNRTIPFDRVIYAIANFTFYFIILFFGVFLLLTIEDFSFEAIFFESASALGTVGLSTGITSSLSGLGKFVIIILMFIGRIGPLTFGIVLLNRRKIRTIKEYEDIVI
ncbi:MAG: potassium transporter TrkH [Candidatus Cloacimonetes bacterium]|nr:potassium transporter TrkH [Candidatus Cloacimonadota bacterium]